MKFYIASKLENFARVKELSARLEAAGWELTYDWTVHGSIKSEGADRLAEVGENELTSVLAADVVIVLLPGGRGTHVELGIALGAHKDIVLCATDNFAFKFNENTTSFYWCKTVSRFIGDVRVIADMLIAYYK